MITINSFIKMKSNFTHKHSIILGISYLETLRKLNIKLKINKG